MMLSKISFLLVRAALGVRTKTRYSSLVAAVVTSLIFSVVAFSAEPAEARRYGVIDEDLVCRAADQTRPGEWKYIYLSEEVQDDLGSSPCSTFSIHVELNGMNYNFPYGYVGHCSDRPATCGFDDNGNPDESNGETWGRKAILLEDFELYSDAYDSYFWKCIDTLDENYDYVATAPGSGRATYLVPGDYCTST